MIQMELAPLPEPGQMQRAIDWALKSEHFARWNHWMHDRESGKMVKRDGQDYLERRYLVKLKRTLVIPNTYLLHTFWMNDPDPLHDHPWPWGRMILSGSYREHYLDGTHADFGPGHIVWKCHAREAHRVELLSERVTTIFWHWGRTRTWGFYHATGWEATPDEAQDGRPMVGWLFPRKIGDPPKEAPNA